MKSSSSRSSTPCALIFRRSSSCRTGPSFCAAAGSAVAGADLPLAQRLQDVVLGPVRDDLAVVADQQAVDQGQQRAAVRHQEQRLTMQRLPEAIGSAHVSTPVTNAHLVSRLLL